MIGTVEIFRRWRSRRQGVWRFISADWVTLAAMSFLLIVIVTAIFANLLAPYNPAEQAIRQRLLPPGSPEHLLGTDSLGRDVLSRLIHGARLSLLIALTAVTLGLIVGSLLGMVSGYIGGTTDAIIMRIVDGQMAFSSFLLILVIVVVIGPGVKTLILVFIYVSWIPIARVVRGASLNIRKAEYLLAARSIGCTNMRIFFHHMLPNLSSIIMSMGVVEMARLMLAEATLSFLGFGVQPPNVTWGLMVAEGRNYLELAWWLTVFPGLSIALTILATMLVGTWLRARADPSQRELL